MIGNKESNIKKEYLSVLNIIAAYCVVLLHCTMMVFDYQENRVWGTSLLLQTMAHWAVPVFLMITGANLLNYRERYSTKTYFKKRIRRVVVPFIIWSIIYAFWKNHVQLLNIKYMSQFISLFFNNGIEDIFWYFYVLIPIYLFIPLLTKFADRNNKASIKYLFLLCFITTTLKPLTQKWLGVTYTPYLNITFADGYISYVLLGWLLHNTEFSLKKRKLIYLGGCIGVLTMFLGTIVLSKKDMQIDTYLMNYQSISCYLISIAVFVLAKYFDFNKLKSVFVHKALAAMSSSCLGVYLIHKIVIYYFNKISIIPEYSIWYMAIASVSIFILSIIIVTIYRKLVSWLLYLLR